MKLLIGGEIIIDKPKRESRNKETKIPVRGRTIRTSIPLHINVKILNFKFLSFP
ncbi:MAG: hypothetical protein ACFE8G_04700 [Candidatus Hermodarchaeota archaeon]